MTVATAVLTVSLLSAAASSARKPPLHFAYAFAEELPMTAGMPFDLYASGMTIETAAGDVSCDFAFENAFMGTLKQNGSSKDTIELQEPGSPVDRGEESCESTVALGSSATVSFLGPHPMGTLALSSNFKAMWQATAGASINVQFSGGTRCAYGYKKLKGTFELAPESPPYVEPMTFAKGKLKRKSNGCPNAQLTLDFQYATTESGWIVEGKVG